MSESIRENPLPIPTAAADAMPSSLRCRNLAGILNEFYPNSDRSQIRVADLGCYEGEYSVEIARQGYAVLGIEARERHFRKCLEMKERLGLRRLDFVKDDARSIAQYGEFDAIVCSGLLYHLDRPRAFLKILGDVTKTLLILNTHFAPDDRHDRLDGVIRMSRQFLKKHAAGLFLKLPLQAPAENFMDGSEVPPVDKYKLSRIVRNEGLRGRWYTEHGTHDSPQEKELKRLASIDNNRSFWLTKKELVRALRESGFCRVEERPDEQDGISASRMLNIFSRGTFLGIRE